MIDSRVKILQECKGISIKEGESGEQTFVCFDTDAGVIAIAMDDGLLGLLVSMILEHANSKVPKKTGVHEVMPANFDPIHAQAIAIEKGPKKNTAIVAFMMGNVNVTFVVNKKALQSTCARMASEII